MLGFFFMKNETEMMFFCCFCCFVQGAKGDPGLSPGQAMKGEQVRESLLTALISPLFSDDLLNSQSCSALFCCFFLPPQKLRACVD